MTAPALRISDRAAHAALARLEAVTPGPWPVVSCYLKLEPRDKTARKYLIKIRNRVRRAVAELAGRGLDRPARDAVAADLARLLRFFEEPGALPRARGVAVYVSGPRRLFEVIPLPQVHRSRLAVAPTPLVRELVALEQEFGTVLVAACDRRAARFFTVTAFDVQELPGLAADASRSRKFRGDRRAVRGGRLAGGLGEFTHHNRIREEKQRHYARVAEEILRVHAARPLAGLVVAGIGVDAAALVPHLHTYLHDLLYGVVKLNPKDMSLDEVRDAALLLREERKRAWERTHAAAVADGRSTGWAVNGVERTLAALAAGAVRTLVADGADDDPRIDDAVEEALRQRAQVDVLYDARARRAVDGLGALLRFRL